MSKLGARHFQARRKSLHTCAVASALGAFLVVFGAGRGAQALPIDGPDLPDDPDYPSGCVAKLRVTFTATPSVIDRDTSPDATTLLQWSVVAPRSCPVPVGVTMGGRALGNSGEKRIQLTHAGNILLQMKSPARTLATVHIAVAGDPGLISVSPGPELTTDDLREFNQQWMQPYQRKAAMDTIIPNLTASDPSIVWMASERMAAMVRMYELTFDKRYLDHLKEISEQVLRYRDDRPGAPVTEERPVEQILGLRGVPAWGGAQVSSGNLHRDEAHVSSLYAYPLAAFARIVAENPQLQSTAYGDLAIEYANRLFETAAFYLHFVRTERVGDFVEATLVQPIEYKSRPTEADCENAYNALGTNPPNASYWSRERDSCLLLQQYAGLDVPHNYKLTFAMVLIELARVFGTDFYRQSPKRSELALASRDSLLLTALRLQRHFRQHLTAVSLPLWPPTYRWRYGESGPSDHIHVEDLDHGSMDMSAENVFQRNFGLLDTAGQRFGEPFSLFDAQRMANTFLSVTGDYDFKTNLDGKDDDSDDHDANTRCEGWVTLAWANSTVYQRCHDVSLRVVDGKQPYLNMGNHSSILANKRFAPR